ncbi:hypothetical protein ACFVTY_31360 [Streptomyces sp. NPDC058067]|uniref:hypothetical protein n=1 Tax=Streptomyces sp. NPDC058067 TaxID=3346324 RepID=UPI0036E668E9
MATANPNAVPSSGVIHIRVRLTKDFCVLANRLLQRRGSAVTVGVAAYIFSLPEGAPITIKSLREHFDEGEILIARALRELEAEGWLERRVQRMPDGRVVTRTYVYDAPGTTPTPPPPPQRPAPTPPRPPASRPATPNPEASSILRALPLADGRLTLSPREVTSLAPAVAAWLESGANLTTITDALSASLPEGKLHSPAGLLSHRLKTTPTPTAPKPRAKPHPFQDCPKCDRPFRAPEPGKCRDCRERAAA